MDVEQTARISLAEGSREDSHEPGEHDGVWCKSIDCIPKGRIKRLSGLVGSMVDDDRWESPGLRMRESMRVGPIRQDC